MLSKEFNVTINTLLGSPKNLICQCCGMPLEDELVGHDKDGFLNEDYCKWCYADETFTYDNMDDLIEVCVKNLVAQGFSEEQAKTHLQKTLPTLNYWKNHTELSDGGESVKFLNDQTTYLGNQLEAGDSKKCFGVLANIDFIMICTYESECKNPQLLLYKKR